MEITETDLTARAAVEVNATKGEVWEALTDPDAIKEYMFGADVVADWREGGRITWSGEFKGKKYQDKGNILKLDAERTLQYTHFSPLAGKPDKPENYHTVTIELSENGDNTKVALEQDNNSNEKGRLESVKNWNSILGGLRDHVEKRGSLSHAASG